jgi:phosphoglycerate kinase
LERRFCVFHDFSLSASLARVILIAGTLRGVLDCTHEQENHQDIDVSGKRVLVRVDYNVPLDEENGQITDDARIRETVPTLRYLLDNGAKIILMAHMGRPKGKVVESMRLAPAARRLQELLGQPIATTADCVGPEAEAAVAKLGMGEVLLLENLRFHAEEEANDAQFANQLAQHGEIYVNDAFGAAHRAHASTEGVAKIIRDAVRRASPVC